MKSLRLVVGATLLLALVMAVTIIFLNEQGATAFVTVEFLVVPLFDALATIYVWRLALARNPRSWLLLFMAITCTMTTVGLGLIDWTLVRRLLGAEPLGLVLSTDIYAVAIWLTGTVPIQKGVLFWLVQRERDEIAAEEQRLTDQAHPYAGDEGSH